MSRQLVISLWIGALLLAPMPAAAATLVVGGGGAFQTVQSAIDAATPMVDEVLVRCGVYVENIVMRDGVSVAGEHPTCAVLDGAQAGSVVTMIGVGAGTELRSLTLRNGLGDFGGGIYIEDSAATVSGNRIEGNRTNAFGSGGGIFVAGSFAAQGGAAAPIISGNLILANTAEETGGGIEIFSGEGVRVANNVLAGNTAAVAGGGICVLDGGHSLLNNTVLHNCSQAEGPACDLGGGGIAIVSPAPVELSNNVVAFNEAAFGAGGVDITNGAVAFASNDVFGNLPTDYAGVVDPTGQDGNLSVDPLLLETGSFNGYQPRSDSPLLDAAVAAAPALDLRGVQRPRDGDLDGVATADIGARENEGLTRLRFDDDGVDLRWDAAANGATASHNVYRGGLGHLRETGALTQDPATVVSARRWCGLAESALIDPESPLADGEGFFYLAVGVGTVEGSLGLDSRLAERPFAEPNRCP